MEVASGGGWTPVVSGNSWACLLGYESRGAQSGLTGYGGSGSMLVKTDTKIIRELHSCMRAANPHAFEGTESIGGGRHALEDQTSGLQFS